MSAIAGILCLDHSGTEAEPAERMAAALARAGHPGVEEGSYRSPEGRATLAALGASHPLANETHDIWLALDGEILNHRALRHTLALMGHRFRTRCDAEVALHAYEQWELDFPAHLQGAFALALWDDRRDRLVLARDRLGHKPLFVAEHRGRLAFASGIRPLLEQMELPRRLNPTALSHYLSFGAVPAPATLVSGVAKLGAGELLVADRHAPPRRQRWHGSTPEPRRAQAVRSLPLDRHAGSLRTLLECSVADRLPARAGVWLMPSPASAAIAAIAARLTGSPLPAVILGEDVPAWARGRGMEPRPVAVGADDVARVLPTMVARMAEPVSSPDTAAGWFAAAALAENRVTALLADTGAAELLLTHGAYAPLRTRPWSERLRYLLGRKPPRPQISALGLRAMLAVALPQVAPPQLPAPPWAEGDRLALRGQDDLHLMIAECSAPGLDGAAQAHGLETRLPYLDDSLATYALAIPGRLRPQAAMRGMFSELARGIPSAGETLPWSQWLAGPLAGKLLDAAQAWPLLDARSLARLLEAHRSRPIHAERLWALLILAQWCADLGLTEVAEVEGRVEVEA
ncbi:MAG TPA: asparagine synthase-related protein [Magnetospirillum sp.]|jgi:asparagine synthase (glutamine-hydrolysing)|nr:asparagine synthase-related protein [Magnetospirillum sp.]